MLGMVRGFRIVLVSRKQTKGSAPAEERPQSHPTPLVQREHLACARLGTSTQKVTKDMVGCAECLTRLVQFLG